MLPDQVGKKSTRVLCVGYRNLLPRLIAECLTVLIIYLTVKITRSSRPCTVKKLGVQTGRGSVRIATYKPIR